MAIERSYKIYKKVAIIIGSGAAGLNAALQLTRYGLDPGEICVITDELGGGTSFNAGSDKQTYYKLSMVGSQEDSPVKMAHALFDGGAMHGDIALIESAHSPRAFFNLVSLGVNFPHNLYGEYVGYKTDNDPNSRGTSLGPLTSKIMGQKLLEELRRINVPIFDGLLTVKILTTNDDNGGKKRVAGAVAIDIKELKHSARLLRERNNGSESGPDEYNLLKETLEKAVSVFLSDFVILATGGPASIYQYRVYPPGHWGSMSLGIEAGIFFQNLTESQFGLASLKFKWNLSGSYQQVIPRYFSIDPDDDPMSPKSPREFLFDYFPGIKEICNATFLKGYQWPFNPERIADFGSSLIDLAVHIERNIKGRRTFIDFRENPKGFSYKILNEEAREYLIKAGVINKNNENTPDKPIDRLIRINPKAYALFKTHDIDLSKEPLEIAVCAQHCNGGVSGDIWWESSLRGLFAVGEVNGTHGVHRPGGAALNSGQVGGFRAAERIVFGYLGRSADTAGKTDSAANDDKESRDFSEIFPANSISNRKILEDQIEKHIGPLKALIRPPSKSEGITDRAGNGILEKIRVNMMNNAAYIRDIKGIESLFRDIPNLFRQFFGSVYCADPDDIIRCWRVYDSLLTYTLFIVSIRDYLLKGGGSRGSAAVIDPDIFGSSEDLIGILKVPGNYKEENGALKDFIQKIRPKSEILSDYNPLGMVISKLTYDKFAELFEIIWEHRRPIPEENSWFEPVQKLFDSGQLFKKN